MLRKQPQGLLPSARSEPGTLVKALEDRSTRTPHDCPENEGRCSVRAYVMEKIEGQISPTSLSRTISGGNALDLATVLSSCTG